MTDRRQHDWLAVLALVVIVVLLGILSVTASLVLQELRKPPTLNVNLTPTVEPYTPPSLDA
jgi:hypothetical protein